MVERAPPEPGWGHEVKFDGYHMQLRVENGDAQLRTRKGIDWTAKFGGMAAAASALPDCLLDGEAMALDKHGEPDFAALQEALSEHKTAELIYFVFDLLFAGGARRDRCWPADFLIRTGARLDRDDFRRRASDQDYAGVFCNSDGGGGR